MKIKFQGLHKTEEVLDSLAAILRLFEEQYGVGDFSEIKLNLTLVNDQGEEVELIDASTSEVFDVLEVHRGFDESEQQTLLELDQVEQMEQIEQLERFTDGTLH